MDNERWIFEMILFFIILNRKNALVNLNRMKSQIDFMALLIRKWLSKYEKKHLQARREPFGCFYKAVKSFSWNTQP